MVSLGLVDSDRNVGVFFDEIFTFSNNILALSKLCLIFVISDAFAILIVACTTATAFIHCNIHYCKSPLLNLPVTQINNLHLVLNSATCVVTRTPKVQFIILPIL